MKINEMASNAHKNANSKGFYDETEMALNELDPIISKLKPQIYDCVKQAFIAQRLALITSEVSEALEAARKGHFEPGQYIPDKLIDEMSDAEFAAFYKHDHKDRFAAELAGTIIRIGDLAAWLGIDLERAVELEMRFNSTRPHKHGKTY